MLTPEELENVSNDVVELYSNLENELIRDIIRRIVETGEISSTTELRIRTAQELGVNYNDLIKTVAKYTNKSERCIRETFEQACIKSLDYDDKIYRSVGLNPIPLKQSANMLQIIEATLEKTNMQFNNLTMSMVNSGQKIFIDGLNKTYLKTITGAFSYNEAVKKTIDELSKNGLYIEYPSGRRDCVDVAVKRAVRTGVVQTSGKLQEMRAKDMGCEYYEISAHVGARNIGTGYCNHESWQGKVFKIEGSTGEYPNFKSSTGYGKIQGLCGINCRHAFFPFFPGISKRAYTDEELKDISNQTVTYNGQKIKKYQAEQMQRSFEREIRKTKRSIKAYEGAINGTNNDKLKSELSNKLLLSRNKLVYQVNELENFKKQINKSPKTVNKNIFMEDKKFSSNDTEISEYGNSKFLNKEVEKICDHVYNQYNKNGCENITLVDTKTNSMIGGIHTDYNKHNVSLSSFQKELIRNYDDRSILLIHNHPNNSTFSFDDVVRLIENKKIENLVVVTDEYNYFLEPKDIEKIDLKKLKVEFKEARDKEIIRLYTIKNKIVDNDDISLIYKDIFESLGWNYGRRKR